jgi:metal-sulfur cluster biosynthetic enzyme
VTADDIRARLNEIADPCSIAAGAPAGLVEMGLVRDVTVRDAPDGAVVRVRIGLTEPGCMMGASFVVRTRECLEGLPGIACVDVELEHDCDWTPRDLDPGYASRLQTMRARRQQAYAARAAALETTEPRPSSGRPGVRPS